MRTMPGLHVLIIDAQPALARMAEALRGIGNTVMSGSGDEEAVLDLAVRLRPDVMVIPSEHPAVAAVAPRLARARITPVVLAIGEADGETVERAKRVRAAGVIRCDAAPLEAQVALELAVLSHRDRSRLESTVARLEEALQARKAVEQAKGLLMDRLGLKESEAYARLRRMAMDSRKSLREVAEVILAWKDVPSSLPDASHPKVAKD